MVAIQGAARACLLFNHATPEIMAGYRTDIIKMFWTGTRYDIRIACYALALLFVMALIFSVTDAAFNLFKRIFPALATFFTAIIALITVINFYYFKTYDNHIDVFIFSLIDDDTTAIIRTIWADYPVIWVILGTIAGVLVLYFFYKSLVITTDKIVKKKRSPLWVFITGMIIIGLFVIGLRGSVGKFPLRRDNAQISSIKLLNSLTPNAGMALDWAWKDYKISSVFAPATDEEGRFIMEQFFGHPVEPSLDVFYETTPPFTLKRKPHVVIAFMESMGSHLLSYDSPEIDILGGLRTHWNEDYVFERFVSEGDGTIDSLSRLLIRSYNENISMSTAQNVDFESNMLKPYLNNGYKVIFVTSGSGSWRNLNGFLPNLGVSEFVEQNTLIKLYPEAKLSPWGIPDEYMFDYIVNRLVQAEKDDDTLLVIALSTTFHPPYKTPASYTPPDFNLSSALEKRLSNLSSLGSISNVFETLRYTNDKLGDFLSATKSSDIGQHTLIAITGDHNIRGIGYPDPKETVLGHAVPLYIYLPKTYDSKIHFDPLTPSSHKDIWPTLYNLTLPSTYYYNMGCDLFAEEKSEIWCFGYNKDVIFNEKGAYLYNSFRPWADTLLLGEIMPMNTEEEIGFKRYSFYNDLLRWQLNRQINPK